ncbi:MAG: electron transport complex subunit RsxC [Clostridia bacterium]|nr:electron transport complex subunit RsxC [Clostridia bacterium]
MAFGFKGGIHPDDKKSFTERRTIEEMPAPKQVILPMSMHIGAPCSPLVKVGDRVLLGQKIAEAASPVSAPVHASVSGTVVAVEPRPHPNGTKVMSVVIENDFEDEKFLTTAYEETRFADISATALADICYNAGIVGLGGAAFPTKIKIESAVDKVDTLIINGAECEPYITSDNRLMIEHGEEVLDGASLVMRSLGLKTVHIGIESNKKEAIGRIKKYAESMPHVKIHVLHTKYPQGSEKHLIKAVTGREVPPGQLPSAVGVINTNVATCVAISRAVRYGTPLTTKVVTVSGSAIANPKNLLVRIGTPISEVIECAGGLKADPYKVIFGGPMMGVAQHTIDVPIIKGTNAILAFCEKEDKIDEAQTCIHCGKCVGVCPMNLEPLYLNMYAKRNMFEELEQNRLFDCIECGCCSYICPGRIHLVHTFRTAKARYNEMKKGAK